MIGRRLGDFLLVEKIAEGGLSEVWSARHEGGLPAAVKVLNHFGTEEEADRFRNEVRASAGLSHPGIVTVLDYGLSDDGTPWLAMELVGGGVLGPERVNVWADLTFLAYALLDALGHAHARGIVHRDMKPANVLVTGPGDVRQGIKLTDFGIAWVRRIPSAEEKGQTGTLPYMAPEQIEVAPHRFGPWTDLYGLGCLLWHVATGAPPFAGHQNLVMAHLVVEPGRFMPRFPVPDGFEAWLRQLLAKDPLHRFLDAAAARRALSALDPASTPDDRFSPPPVPIALQGAGMRLFGLRDVPMVGRERERKALERLLDAVADDGIPRVAAVRGPAGAGRSRLLRWFAEHLRETGAAEPLTIRPSGGTEVRAAIFAHLGAAGLDGDALREHLSWRVGASDVQRELVDVLAPPAGREVDHHERLRAIRRWLVTESSRRPMVVIIDDAHRTLDACTLARRLLEPDGGGSCRALVVFSVREESLAELDPSPALEDLLLRAEPIPLSPLGRVDRLVLLHRHLAVDPHLASKLDEETGGNPLLSIELLRDYVERRWLEPGRDGLRLVAGREVVVPEDRLGPWTSRLRRAVEPDAWSELEVAAALGEEVRASEWHAVGDPTATERRHELVDGLLAARLADPTPSGFRFAHPLVRQAVLRNARLSGTFKAVHRACLAWLRQRDADPERVARHLVAIEAWEEAADPLLEAADERHRRDGPGSAWEALRLAEQALVRAGIAPPDARWVRLWLLRAKVLQERGRRSDALGLLDRADQAIDSGHGPSHRAWSRHVRGLVLADLGRSDEAMELHLENARALERSGTDDAQLALTLDALSVLAMHAGHYGDAMSWAAGAESILTRLGIEGRRGINLIRQANIASMLGDEPGAHALFDRAEPLVLRYGALTHRAFLYNDRGDLLIKQDRWSEAEPLFHRAMELWRAAGYRALTATLNLALCRLRQGRVDEAEALVHDARISGEAIGSTAATAGALVLAVCAAHRRTAAELERQLERAEPGLGRIAEPDFAWLLRRAAAASTEAALPPDLVARLERLASAQEQRLTAAE